MVGGTGVEEEARLHATAPLRERHALNAMGGALARRTAEWQAERALRVTETPVAQLVREARANQITGDSVETTVTRTTSAAVASGARNMRLAAHLKACRGSQSHGGRISQSGVEAMSRASAAGLVEDECGGGVR